MQSRKLRKGLLLIAGIFLLLNAKLSVHAQPVFSQKHGFFETPFNLIISPLTTGSTIYYTTDGSAPDLTNGTLYTAPLFIDTLSIIRAVEIKDNKTGKIATCTYLFLDDIIRQPNNPSGYPTTWGPYTAITGTAIADYEMDPEMMADVDFANSVKAALLDLPVISLVTDKGYLFSKSQDPDTGGIYIYTGPPLTNTTNGLGFGWERPVSFEYFDASDSVSLQVDCGVQIQGGHGRRPEKSPKHSFRLVFKSIYGPSKLNYPLFGKDADSVFNSIILRASFGNTWIHWSHSERSMAQYLRDRWTKDTHKEMGHISSHGIYVHLFINGIYWGLYNPSERLDSDFAATYLGGNKDDYDVIKDYVEVVDGNINAWITMISMANSGLATKEAYQRIRGNNADGTPNPGIEPLVDVVSLADYMLLNFYGGNWDWDHHNWVAIRNRVNPWKGFQFFCWDEEHMVEGVNANILSENNNYCPSRVFQQLRQNEDFRRLFADRIQKFCFNGGALTPLSAAERWINRANQIDKAVDAESARWGDYRRDVHPWQAAGPFDLYTKESYWLPQMNYLLSTYFPNRTDAFIGHLRTAGLYPETDAPVFLINGKPVAGDKILDGDILTMSADDGVIYYTKDGSDPVLWQTVPVLSQGALMYTGQITLNQSSHIKARTYSGVEWSATNEQFFIIPKDFNDIKITEIHYHPLDQGVIDGSEFEFIELKNTGTATLDLGGLRFSEGISFVFPMEVPLKPGEFIVLASNSKYFTQRYGFLPFASYDGHLENNGEKIVLISSDKDTICSLYYSNGNGWPSAPDNYGNSLVPTDFNPDNNQNSPDFWRASYKTYGSPGADDILTSEGESSELCTIYQNYPNPFSSSTSLPYQLHEDAHINISVLNITGRYIITLEDADKPSGYYSVEWNGLNQENCIVSNGIYFYRVTVRSKNGVSVVNKKMLKIR